MKDVFLPESVNHQCMRKRATHTAHLDPVLVECGPFDHITLERIVDLRYQLEGQCLKRVSITVITPDRKSECTLSMVVGGMQWLSRS